MKKLKAAVLGCGAIGSEFDENPKEQSVSSHAGAYHHFEGTELYALCDLDSKKLNSASEKWKPSKVFSHPEEVFNDREIEILSIATPNSTHGDLLEKALGMENIKGILVEKPLALDPFQAESILKQAEAKQILVSTNYSRRFSPGFQKCATLIQEGHIGNIQWVQGHYTKGLLHNGVHWLDLAFWFFNSLNNMEVIDSPAKSNLPIDEIGLNISWNDSHSKGSLISLDAEKYSLFEMDVLGEKGRIKILDSGNRIEHYSVEDSPYYSGYQTLVKKQEFDGEMQFAIVEAIKDLCGAIAENSPLKCSGFDGLKSLKLAHNLVSGTQS